MANTLDDLYYKYQNKVSRALETDRYFQYMFEMIMAGENTIKQNNHILHKKVDEKWLKMVEESMMAIDNIINKPRRFIATDQELVPVDLAKKITADSVRHLSQNTQYVQGIDRNNNVLPSHILNVTTRESYDLYENRFVYWLIKKLVAFIDKRTDIIFWSTGDEQTNSVSIESKVDDAYEQIEYRMEMVIKSKQSYTETDNQHMDVFKRIDRVRRVVMELYRSPFMKIMEGCSRVNSPIQRTNLLTKDPNYRKCYQLWQFLEGYDDVGYTIEVKDTALDFDEDYLFQLYTNELMNYTVFKSLLEADQRRIDEAKPLRKKTVKPKFVKKIVEQIVDDYDIPDVEIRKVIIEEITKAEMEIEKRKQQRERELEKQRAIKEKEREKARLLKEKEKEKERLAKEKEKARLLKEKEKEKLAAKKLREKELEKARIAKEKEAEKLRLAKEKEREKAKLLKAKEAEKAKQLKLKEAEKAKQLKLKEAEKAKQLKAKEAEKAKQLKLKEAEKARIAREKEKEKARLLKEKERIKKGGKKPVKKPVEEETKLTEQVIAEQLKTEDNPGYVEEIIIGENSPFSREGFRFDKRLDAFNNFTNDVIDVVYEDENDNN